MLGLGLLDETKFDAEAQRQLAALGLWAGGRIRPDLCQQVGRLLYNALTVDPEGKTALSTARDSATEKGLPLSYRLRFPPAAVDLAALPWELLWDDEGALLLSQSACSPWVRYLDLDRALKPPAPPRSTLRILAVAPNARIPDDIRADERAARTDAWSKLAEAGVVTMEELSPATPSALFDRISSGPAVDILHFYGHGRYKDGVGALLFDLPGGGETWITADKLAALLGDVRLVMLLACQSAMSGVEGLLTGVAPALSAAGVPAVVAMQLTVRVAAATRFAGIVYRALANGDSVQRAVSQARQALYFEESDGASWYVPTLTIRSRELGPLRLVQKA